MIVCLGNICRSPTAERILQQQLPLKTISSAGIQALVGHDIDKNAASTLEANGYGYKKHLAKKLDRQSINQADLVLVMEKEHQHLIIKQYPEASGKIFLLGKWQGDIDIHDPYHKSNEVFNYVFKKIEKYCMDWVSRLPN